VQLDEVERVEQVLATNAAIHHASLIGLGVNAPKELPTYEAQFWQTVNAPPVARLTREAVFAAADQILRAMRGPTSSGVQH
jgi:hypothetical protein